MIDGTVGCSADQAFNPFRGDIREGRVRFAERFRQSNGQVLLDFRQGKEFGPAVA